MSFASVAGDTTGTPGQPCWSFTRENQPWSARGLATYYAKLRRYSLVLCGGAYAPSGNLPLNTNGPSGGTTDARGDKLDDKPDADGRTNTEHPRQNLPLPWEGSCRLARAPLRLRLEAA